MSISGRIVFINHTGKVSGAERVLLDILCGLDRSRYSPVVVSPPDGELRAMVEAQGIEWVPMPALAARFTSHPLRLLRYVASLGAVIRALRRTVRDLDPEFVHACTVRAGIAATLATVGTRRTVLWHIHDILPRHPLSSLVRALAFLSRRMRGVAVSHGTARAFCAELPFRSRVQVVYNGTDLSRFPLKTPGDSPLKRELGLPGDAFLICAVGQICPRKGLEDLIHAFSLAAAQVPAMHLAIVGKAVFAHDVPHQEVLIAQAKTTGYANRIHFTGQRSDIASVLQSADLLVLNSREEPFGLVLVEAMSCGTPVLATRVGGIPEIVSDGVNGWLVPSGDIPGLAAKLVQLSQSPQLLARVAAAARQVTCPLFSDLQFHRRLNAVYQDLSRDAETKQAAQPDRAFGLQ